MTIKNILAALAMFSLSITTIAQEPEFTFKLHHFLPPTSTAHQKFMKPWAEKIFADSKGRIKVEIYPNMQLGGRPPELYDQVRKGIVDISWTIAGYTPGRFAHGDVFELPFIATDAQSTSMALQEYGESEMTEDLKDVHLITLHTHHPGVFHSRDKQIKTLADMQGLKVSTANRIMGDALTDVGASPIFMPVTQLPSALSKGVIDVALSPFEVAKSYKLEELVKYHTEFSGDRGLYTQYFIFSMNKKSYNKLPDDLKKVIDDNSGIELAGQIGKTFDEGELPGRAAAIAQKNVFYTIPLAEVAAWKIKMQPVTDKWVKEHKDGARLYQKAQDLIAKYEKQNSKQ